MAYLSVNGFKFALTERSGDLQLWRCVKTQCTARFYTNGYREQVSHEQNSLVHNHLLSRTKMVKALVFEEVRKFMARRGDAASDSMVREHALKYLDQAFGATLNLNEMRCVKSAIIKYAHIYKAHLKKSGSANDFDVLERPRRRREDGLSNWKGSGVGKEDIIETILDVSDDSDDAAPDVVTVDEDAEPAASSYSDALTVACPDDDWAKPQQQQPQYPVYAVPGGLVPSGLMLEPPTVYFPAANYPLASPGGSSSQSSLEYLSPEDPAHFQPLPDQEDEDERFFSNLLPMFRRLDTKDKMMLKAQFHQLVNWKLKNVV